MAIRSAFISVVSFVVVVFVAGPQPLGSPQSAVELRLLGEI